MKKTKEISTSKGDLEDCAANRAWLYGAMRPPERKHEKATHTPFLLFMLFRSARNIKSMPMKNREKPTMS